MAASLGDLVVSLSANTAAFTAAMTRAEYTAQQSSQRIAGMMRSIQTSIAAVGVGVSVAGIVHMAKSALEAADAMGDAAERAGMAVEQFSALAYAAKQSDVSLETLEGTAKKLSVAIAAAAAGDKKYVTLFEGLGTSVFEAGGKIKSTQSVLLSLADTFEKSADGPVKVAAAVELLGKNGAAAIPLLNKGSDAINKFAQEARDLGKVIDSETAAAADKFNKDIEKLTNNSAGLARSLTSSLVPALTDVVAAMMQAKRDSGALMAVWVGLGGIGNLIFNDGMSQYGPVEERLAKTNEKMADLKKVLDDIKSSGGSPIAPLVEEMKRLTDLSGQLAAQMAIMRQQSGAGLDARDLRLRGPSSTAPKTDPDPLKLGLGGSAAAAGVDKYATSLAALYERLDKTSNLVGAKFVVELKMLHKEYEAGRMGIEQYNGRVEALILSTKSAADLNKRLAESLAFLDEEHKKDIEFVKARAQALDDLVDGWQKESESLQIEIELIGLSNLAREKALLLIKRNADLIAANGEPSALRDINALYEQQIVLLEKRDGQLKNREALEQSVSAWSELADRGSQFFTDLVFNGKSAFKNLGDSLKSFAKELLALFARRWILNMVGNATGGNLGASLLGAAAQQGAGSIAGSLLGTGSSLLGAAGTVGTFFSGIGAGFTGSMVGGAAGLGATVAGSATGIGSLAGGAGALGSTIGTAIAAVPVWGWIAAAVLAVAAAVRDKGENWRGQLQFGGTTSAYSTEGVFGREGFSQLAGNDGVNRSIQAFMASTGAIDTIIARTLSAAQISTISGNLAGQSQREFAFPRDDQTAGQQLTLEYLQRKYGTMFDEIDTTFAAFVRGYTGKAEDLVNEIGEFARLIEALGSTSIKGMNIEALRAFQVQGETIGQTFQRVTVSYAQFVDAFTSDADKLLTSQALLTTTFGDLGIAIPASNDAFLALVQGLDVSTVAGRTMFSTLLQIAPTFQAVGNAALQASQAARQAAAGFAQSMATIYGAAYTQQQRQTQILSLISQLSSLSPLIAGLGSPSQILAGLANIGPSVWQSFRDQNAGNSAIISLIDQIAALYAAMQQGSSGTGSGDWLYNFGDPIKDLGAAAADLAKRLAEARAALVDYMNSLLLSKDLSPLTPTDRLAEAKRQYEAMLTLAQGGDIDAIRNLSGSADSYLKIAREIFASSSAYNAIFRQVFGELGSVAGKGAPSFESAFNNALPVNSKIASSADVGVLTQAVYDLITLISNGVTVNDPQIAEQTNAITSAVKRVGSTGALL